MKIWRCLILTSTLFVAASSLGWGFQLQRVADHRGQGQGAPSSLKPPTNQGYNTWAKFHQDNLNSGQGYSGGSNGLLKWKTPLGSAPVASSSAVHIDGSIVVGAEDDNVYVLNTDGTVKSTLATGDKVVSSPALDISGTVYVGSNDGNLYRYVPGSQFNWMFPTGGPIVAPPTVSQSENTYFGSSDHYFYSVDTYGNLR